jgi:hypothetical protein
MSLAIVFSAIAVLFIVIGVAIKYYKCYWLISGYNTATEEKRENIDVEGLGKFIGNCCFVMGVLFVLGAIVALMGSKGAAVLVIILVIGVIIYMLIQAQKYDANTRNPDGSMNKKTKIAIGSVIAFIVVTFSIVFGSIQYNINTEHVVTVNNEAIKVNGTFGTQVKFDEIKEVTLKKEAPVVMYKKNGLYVADICRGSFKVKDMGIGMLYAHLNSKPYIYIIKNEGYVIINFKDSNSTQELYNKIMENWQ